MYQSSLVDLINGIKASPGDEAGYIHNSLRYIREELISMVPSTKAQAVEKLVFLQMYGFDVSWASFHIVQVASLPSFEHRRLGLLAASLSVQNDTEVVVLTTQLFQKILCKCVNLMDLKNSCESETTLSCLSIIATDFSANALYDQIFALMSSGNPIIARKAILTMLRILEKQPASLRNVFYFLKEKLHDDDADVRSVAINVLCELAQRNSQNYKSLAPLVFRLFIDSGNNWCTIKLSSVLGYLMSSEPRLADRVIPSLIGIVISTPVKSVLSECLQTILRGIPFLTNPVMLKSTLSLCAEKIQDLLENNDPNLKFIGLSGLEILILYRPKAIHSFMDIIRECLASRDLTIQLKALDIAVSSVSKKNLHQLTDLLIGCIEKTPNLEFLDAQPQMEESCTFSKRVLVKILDMCSKNRYSIVTNFRWYVELLFSLITRPRFSQSLSASISALISSQLLDLATLVPDICTLITKYMAKLLVDPQLSSIGDNDNIDLENRYPILSAAAWLVGESSRGCIWTQEESRVLFQSLIDVGSVSRLSSENQAIFIHAAFKVFHSCTKKLIDQDIHFQQEEEWRMQVFSLAKVANISFKQFSYSEHYEVQERSCLYRKVVSWIQTEINFISMPILTDFLSQCDSLFHENFNQVETTAQNMLLIQKCIDLNSWISEPLENIRIQDVQNGLAQIGPRIARMNRYGVSEEDLETKNLGLRAVEERKKRHQFYLESSMNTLSKNIDFADAKDDDFLTLMPSVDLDEAEILSTFELREDEFLEGAIETINRKEIPPLSFQTNDLNTLGFEKYEKKMTAYRKSAERPKPTRKFDSAEDLSTSALQSIWTRKKILCGDEILRIKYEPTSDSTKVFIHFAVAFKPQDNEKLCAVYISFNSSDIKPPSSESTDFAKFHGISDYDEKKGGFLILEKQKQSGVSTRIFPLGISKGLSLEAIVISCRIWYITKLADGSKTKREFYSQICFPSSSFLYPVRVTPNELRDLLSHSGRFSYSASKKINLKGAGPLQALHLVPEITNLFLVKAINSNATFYGKSIRGDEVALLFKIDAEASSLTLETKSSFMDIGTWILSELETAFMS